MRLRSLALLAVCATACLPRGDPPSGRQVVTDRTALLAGVLPASSDGAVRLLIARIREQPFTADFSVVSVPATGAPSEMPLAENVTWNVGCNVGQCFHFDARGRLLMTVDYDNQQAMGTLVRVDPLTGSRTRLSTGGTTLIFSPSRSRLAHTAYNTVTGSFVTTLYESDDRSMVLDGYGGQFAGEDYFYVAPGRELMWVAPGGAPALVRTGVTGFGVQQTDLGPVLLITLIDDDYTSVPATFWDPVTREELVPLFVSGSLPSLSPDRRWMVATTPGNDAVRVRFVDLTTGAEETYDPVGYFLGPAEWRPGKAAELWLQFQFNDPTTFTSYTTALVKKPGELPVAVNAVPYSSFDDRGAISRGGSGSLFTSDGAYWFSVKASQTTPNRLTLQVGSADDPNGPRFDINPEGTTSYHYYRLSDGRLLVEAFRTVEQRSDLYAVDPATGQARLLGKQGEVLAVGTRRVLAKLRAVDGLGDLTVIDLDSGASTVLAPEFTQSAFVETRTGPDPAMPGTTVAFHFRARFDSPYDGIWIATLP